MHLSVSAWRKLVAAGLSVLALVGAAWVADAVIAVRAERHVSAVAAEGGDYLAAPEAYLGGFPFVSNLFTGEIPDLAIEAKQAEVPGWGLVNARVMVKDVELPADRVLDGDLVGAPAKRVARRIGLDAATVGNQIGIPDLYITNTDDLSPGGGPTAEATMRGTPEGFDDPVTVVVSLLLDGPVFTMTPTEFTDVPEDRTEAARDAFTWSFDTRTLPLEQQADRVSLNGGSLFFEDERHETTLRAEDISPLGPVGGA